MKGGEGAASRRPGASRARGANPQAEADDEVGGGERKGLGGERKGKWKG